MRDAFSRRDYVAVADALEGVRDGVDEGGACMFGVELAAEALAALFAEDNPRFSRERFLAACGVESQPVTGMPASYGETLLVGGVR